VSLTEQKQDRASTSLRAAAVRVPALTVAFWVTLGLTAGMAESGSDYLVHLLVPGVALVISGIGLLAALVLQVASGRFVPWIFWLAVTQVGLFGSVATHALQVGLGAPAILCTALLACLLTGLFTAWRAAETTVSIHSVCTDRREAFYWAVVMCTFGLGTAAGELAAVTLDLGYLASGLIFAALVSLPAVARWRLGLSAILAFWLSYLVTCLLGASLADWLAAPDARGGLGLGAGPVSVVLVVLIAGFVAYMSDNPTSEGVADRHPADLVG
jgi:uncharacterized membrane-anchored protein